MLSSCHFIHLDPMMLFFCIIIASAPTLQHFQVVDKNIMIDIKRFHGMIFVAKPYRQIIHGVECSEALALFLWQFIFVAQISNWTISNTSVCSHHKNEIHLLHEYSRPKINKSAQLFLAGLQEKEKQQQQTRFKCIIFLYIFCNESLYSYASNKQYPRWKRERDDGMKRVLMLNRIKKKKAYYCWSFEWIVVYISRLRPNARSVCEKNVFFWHSRIKNNWRWTIACGI